MRSTPACLVQIVPPLPWVGVRVYACGAKMPQSGLLSIKEIAGHVALREGAICTLQEVIRIVHRPEDIDNSAALTFLSGSEGNEDETQG